MEDRGPKRPKLEWASWVAGIVAAVVAIITLYLQFQFTPSSTTGSLNLGRSMTFYDWLEIFHQLPFMVLSLILAVLMGVTGYWLVVAVWKWMAESLK